MLQRLDHAIHPTVTHPWQWVGFSCMLCGMGETRDEPWNSWFHVTVHTYGSWIRGDPRGWRDRNHEVHVDGDYKRPPEAGTYEKLHAYCKQRMARAPVRIEPSMRLVVLLAIVERLRMERIQVIAVSVDGVHVHILAKFIDWSPIRWVGLAKKHASHVVRQLGLRSEGGGLWAKKSYAKPITNRAHQRRAFHYIVNHRCKGGVVWTFRDESTGTSRSTA